MLQDADHKHRISSASTSEAEADADADVYEDEDEVVESGGDGRGKGRRSAGNKRLGSGEVADPGDPEVGWGGEAGAGLGDVGQKK